MKQLSPIEQLDRHALVMALWFGFGFVAVALFKLGVAHESWAGLASGFAAVLCGFVAHVLINVVFETRFSPREVALGLFIFAICLLWFGLAVILYPQYHLILFLPISLGFVALTAAVIFTMITWLGLRGTFESFDVIRRFAPERRR